MDKMDKKQLLELLHQLKIDVEEFVILSSGALVLRGIMDRAGDLDIAVTKKGFEQLKKSYNLIPKENEFYIVNDKVECVLNDMKDRKEKVGEYYLQDIKDYLKFIESSNKEKYKPRIPLVKQYIKDQKK